MGSQDVHYSELGFLEEIPERWGQLSLLGSLVLLHLDRVVDFSSPPESKSDSHGSDHSDISGLPLEVSSLPMCPAKWGYLGA